MKITSIKYVFDGGEIVTFTKGSSEKYQGSQVRFIGKNYFYDVTIVHRNGIFTTATFQSPSQIVASEMLKKCIDRISIPACS